MPTKDEKPTARIHDIDVDAFLAECVKIEPLAIEEEYVRMPADLAYWNERYALALEDMQRAKLRSDKLEAFLKIEHRERLVQESKSNKDIKVTESTVEAAVDNDERMAQAREDLLMAEVQKVRIAGTCEAVRTKRDMLISMGAHIRAEMQGDPSIRSAQAGARAMRNGG